MDNIIAGSVAGLSRVTVGYPLDTIKTFSQMKKRKMNISVSGLYRGMSYPLCGSMIINTSLFGIEDYMYKKTDSHFISGGIAGLSTSIITSPIELYKVRSQNILCKKVNLFLGLRSTLLREGIAGPIYFGTFHKLRENGYHSTISGSISGLACLLTTYPLDTVKTRIQASSHVNITSALKVGDLYKGVSVWGIRAILVNAIGFYSYEKCKDLLK
jgi:hypothetical protein